MDLTMPLLKRFLSCEINPPAELRRLSKRRATEGCSVGSGRASVPLNRLCAAKRVACVLVVSIASCQIVVSPFCTKLVTFPLFLRQKLFWISMALSTRNRLPQASVICVPRSFCSAYEVPTFSHYLQPLLLSREGFRNFHFYSVNITDLYDSHYIFIPISIEAIDDLT